MVLFLVIHEFDLTCTKLKKESFSHTFFQCVVLWNTTHWKKACFKDYFFNLVHVRSNSRMTRNKTLYHQNRNNYWNVHNKNKHSNASNSQTVLLYFSFLGEIAVILLDSREDDCRSATQIWAWKKIHVFASHGQPRKLRHFQINFDMDNSTVFFWLKYFFARH